MKRTTDNLKLDFRFSRLQTKIEKRTSSSIFVLKVLNENRKTNIVFDFRFESAKRKSKNEHRLRFSFFKMKNGNRKTNLGVEIRFSICETQNENRIMKRTTDLFGILFLEIGT